MSFWNKKVEEADHVSGESKPVDKVYVEGPPPEISQRRSVSVSVPLSCSEQQKACEGSCVKDGNGFEGKNCKSNLASTMSSDNRIDSFGSSLKSNDSKGTSERSNDSSSYKREDLGSERQGVLSKALPGGPGVTDQELETYLNDRFGKTRSALGPGTVIQGKLSFDTTVRIDGKLGGDVYSSKSIIIGRTGVIEAQVDVGSIVVIGHVKGDIRATERVEIIAGGRVDGTVTTPALVIESGSVLNGSCKMTSFRASDNADLRPPALNSAGNYTASGLSQPTDIVELGEVAREIEDDGLSPSQNLGGEGVAVQVQ